MASASDQMIKKDLKIHIENTTKKIKDHDGWNMINISELSEMELIRASTRHGLENDMQTRDFCKFISIGTNFASMDFKTRIQNIPVLVNSLKDLIKKMEDEIKEYADIASSFHNIIQSFVKVVMNTKHNMKMALPHLEESIVHMRIMADALAPDSENPLSTDDMMDVDLALTNMSYGIVKLLDHAKGSKEESIRIDNNINNLKENIESKITVCESRISFAKFLPKIGATLGMVGGASVAGGAVESIAFGGAGVLMLGGISFPPIGAILLGAAIGAIGIGSLLMLIIKLWEKHQFKALNYLREILDSLNKLNNANLYFMEYMNKSEEDAYKILNNMEFFKKNVKTGSTRYRKTNADICFRAIDSTNEIINTIHQICDIDMRQWIYDQDSVYFSLLDGQVNLALEE